MSRRLENVAITPIQVNVSGGRGSYTYSPLSGAPPGISITSSGLITGAPAQTGSYIVAVTVRDAGDRTASTSFTMRVSPSLRPPSISDVNDATQNVAITPIPLNASGGRGAYAYSLSGSPSKNGIAVSGNSLRGTPGQTGSYTYTVTVRDVDNRTASTSFTMRVSPSLRPPSISDVNDATQNVAITPIPLNASGGRGAYAYSLSGSPSKNGIAVSGNSLRGTPGQTGSYTYTVTVRDVDNRTASTSFTMRVSPSLRPPSISDVNDATQNVAITPIPLNASGGRGAYAYSLSGSPSKNGIAVSGNSLRGTPRTDGELHLYGDGEGCG